MLILILNALALSKRVNLDRDVREHGEMPQAPVVVLGFTVVVGSDRHYRCHVRFQGLRTRDAAQRFSSGCFLQMQACAVEGGAERRLIML